MPREFKPVRFFVIMGVAAFLVCGAVAFFTHRAEHGRTGEERSAYFVGEKESEVLMAAGGKLPTAAALDGIVQDYFKQQGSGEPMAWKLAFEHGYEDGFKKAHR